MALAKFNCFLPSFLLEQKYFYETISENFLNGSFDFTCGYLLGCPIIGPSGSIRKVDKLIRHFYLISLDWIFEALSIFRKLT